MGGELGGTTQKSLKKDTLGVFFESNRQTDRCGEKRSKGITERKREVPG